MRMRCAARAERGGVGRCAPLMALVTLVVLGACNPAPTTVTVRRLAAVAPGSIRRIAVLPFTEAALERHSPVPGQEPLTEPPGETVTRAMTEALQRLGDWHITDPLVVGDGVAEAAVGEHEHIGERRVGERVGGGVRHGAGHVGDAIVDDALVDVDRVVV